MSDDLLFQEVQEEVRREKIKKLWQRFGTYFVAACFGIIATVAGYKGWQYWQQRQAEDSGRAFISALQLLEENKTAQAKSAIEHLAENGSAGVKVLAQLQQAGLLAQEGKTDAAQAAYDSIAKDRSVDAPLQEFAKIRSAYIQVDTTGFDELSDYLKGMDKEDSPWRNSVREILALAAYKQADYIQADRQLNLILSDTGAPEGVRSRAVIFLEIIRPKLGQSSS